MLAKLHAAFPGVCVCVCVRHKTLDSSTYSAAAALGCREYLVLPPTPVINLLVTANPSAASQRDGTGRVPLFHAIMMWLRDGCSESLEAVEALVAAFPDAARQRSEMDRVMATQAGLYPRCIWVWSDRRWRPIIPRLLGRVPRRAREKWTPFAATRRCTTPSPLMSPLPPR